MDKTTQNTAFVHLVCFSFGRDFDHLTEVELLI